MIDKVKRVRQITKKESKYIDDQVYVAENQLLYFFIYQNDIELFFKILIKYEVKVDIFVNSNKIDNGIILMKIW